MAGIDLDRYFVGKDLEELPRKIFDGLGLDVRGVISTQLRTYLKSFFGPDARENRKDTVLRATGEPLNAEHFVKSLP